MGQLLKLSNLKWMLLLLIPASIFVACSDDDYTEPNYEVSFPTADFDFEANKANFLEVSFVSTSNGADTHEWTFGDGGTSTDVNPTHAYAEAGTYEVSLTVTNDRGTITLTQEITVEQEKGAGIVGKWVMAPEAGALGVGPSVGDYSWWTIDDAGVTARACYFDDEYIFNEDLSFQIVLGDATWIEGWQGGSDACGAPVAPHDGTNPATYTDDGSKITVTGLGAYIGLPKAHNGGEDGAPADNTTTYDYSLSEDGNTMEVTLTYPGGVWYYKLIRAEAIEPFTFIGTWKMAPEAGALGVGPAKGNYEWWTSSADDVSTRACFFDDEYIFNEDGSFQNVLGDDTWVEGWQGGSDSCASPVAPHDGSNAATWSSTENTITVEGLGAYLGIPKVHNTGEDGAPDNNTITYDYVASADGKTIEITINYGGGDETWYYKMVKQ